MSSNAYDANGGTFAPLVNAPSIAYLRIHSGSQVFAGGDIQQRSALQRLRELVLHRTSDSESASLHFQIDDLKGFRVFETDAAQSVTKICLPAGTYHVMAQRGEHRRSYTLTLGQGASFDLHLGFSGIPQ